MIDRRTALALIASAVAPGAAEARKAAAWPRRDLTGVWTNAWYTHLTRPRELKSLVLTPAEAAAYEAPRKAHRGELIDREHDVVGQAESEFPDNGLGLATIDGQIRSSWIVDPPDGLVPWRKGVKQNLHLGDDEQPYDNPEDHDQDDRCLTTEGAAAPILNSHDGNLLTMVQSPGWLVIAGEKNHETRIVRILPKGAPPAPDPRAEGLRSWDGESVGHWEGATLVVETHGLRAGVTKLNDSLWLSGSARITERFTRTGPDAIRYDFAVEDPELFTRAWRAESVFRTSPGRMFEYACHEGNYGLPDLLLAARHAEGKLK